LQAFLSIHHFLHKFRISQALVVKERRRKEPLRVRAHNIRWVPAIKKSKILGEAAVSYQLSWRLSFPAGELHSNPQFLEGRGGCHDVCKSKITQNIHV
jgi:hypothetical protein